MTAKQDATWRRARDRRLRALEAIRSIRVLGGRRRKSPAELVAVDPDLRRQFLEFVARKPDLATDLRYLWEWWARPAQLPEGPSFEKGFDTWFLCAGRGFGKTRCGAEWVRYCVEVLGVRRLALVGRTAADVRDVMVLGPSGVVTIAPPWFRPVYKSSQRVVVWPNGAQAFLYSSEKPSLLRGPEHEAGWADEFAAWRYEESWSNLRMGLRMGEHPQLVVTSTPKATDMVKRLLAEEEPGGLVKTGGSSYENLANLSPRFRKTLQDYEGTDIGLQEIWARVLTQVAGALWKLKTIAKHRHKPRDKDHKISAKRIAAMCETVVVAVDPAATAHATSAETGIIVVGIDKKRHLHVIADLSGRYAPGKWGEIVVQAFKRFKADAVVAEVNQGGDMVEHVIATTDSRVPVVKVRATRGKHTRAQPVSNLYRKGRVHHVGIFANLEDQQCTWVPGAARTVSPDRVDALVWGISYLALEGVGPPAGSSLYSDDHDDEGDSPFDAEIPSIMNAGLYDLAAYRRSKSGLYLPAAA